MNWLYRFLRPVWRFLWRFFADILIDLHRASHAARTAIASLATQKEIRVAKGDLSRTYKLRISNFFNPIFWVVQSIGFVFRYLASRVPVAGIQGLPALACLLGCISAGAWLSPSLDKQIAHARGRFELHLEHKEYEQADFFSRQLCFLTPNASEALMKRAELFDRTDREAESRSLLLVLAKERKYLPAVERLCEEDLEFLKNGSMADELREKELIGGLQFILDQQPANVQANSRLGSYYVLRGQFAKALPLLEKAVSLSRSSNPAVNYSLAVAQKKLGLFEKSKANASIAADAFVDRNSRSPYSVQYSIEALRAMILAERESEATSLILESLPHRTEPEAKELKWLLGEVYAEWCKRLREKKYRTVADLARAVDAIYKGVVVSPNNPVVTEEMVQLSCVKDVDDEMLQQQLEVALNSGVSPGLIHFVIGTRLLLAGNANAKEALQHFELAMQHNASLPGLLNNIADAMVEADSADVERALTLVNQAIDLMPDQPYFYDTRGKILLKKGEPLMAVVDLEKALAAAELRPQVHAELAAAYLSLNDQPHYEYHKAMSESYRKQQATPSTTDKNTTPASSTNDQ